MQFSTALIALVAAALTQAQSISDLPSCSLGCLSSALGADGCSSLTDFACHCQKPDLVPQVEPCVISACDTADQEKVLSVVEGICSSVGYPISVSTPAATSAATTTAVAATTTPAAGSYATTTAAASSAAGSSAAGSSRAGSSMYGSGTTAAASSSKAASSNAASSTSGAATATSSVVAFTGAAVPLKQNLGGLAAAAAVAAMVL